MTQAGESDDRIREATPAEQVTQLYRQILRRAPDPDGLAHHSRALAEGTRSVRDMVRDFLQSTEWRIRFIEGKAIPDAVATLIDCALARPATMVDLRARGWNPDSAEWRRFINDVIDGSEYRSAFGEDDVPNAAVRDTTAAAQSGGPVVDVPQPAEPPAAIPASLKAIAFYLPQFHQTVENDEWWGEGFTEWRNVRGGAPLFPGHYQPHTPIEEGQYDLSDPAVLRRQADLAKKFGIYGFCFYYYWFGGRVLLGKPLRQALEEGGPNIPFCLCWANEDWSRRWDGKSDVLIAQTHSPDDDIRFLDGIMPILVAPGYIRVDDKPILLIYRASALPDVSATIRRWRRRFAEKGHGELYLARVKSFTEWESSPAGFDAVVQFPPHFLAHPVNQLVGDVSPGFTGRIYDYAEVSHRAIEELRRSAGINLYGGVMPSWDNAARHRERASVWINSSPDAYYAWLRTTAELTLTRRKESERFVFINAWNEWGEGCHLEPDARYGYAWLNATGRALADAERGTDQGRRSVEVRAFNALPAVASITISVLLYHREDLLHGMMQALLPQLASAVAEGVDARLCVSLNYPATTEARQQLESIIDGAGASLKDRVQVLDHGFNRGFGAGHNLVFDQSATDIFIALNSDVRLREPSWLARIVEAFRTSSTALVGLRGNASRLRDDGCGVQTETAHEPFDFVDGSVVAVRAEAARRYGLFSEGFDYFYFEDADLSLRYRQLGLGIELLDIPFEHARSASSQLLPRFTLEAVLNRNRALFMQRWGRYLQTHRLSDRIGIDFETIDRQVQCASLPAIMALLREQPGAVLEIRGVHEQLRALFHHPRIRILPSWQPLEEGEYLRFTRIAGEKGDRTRPLQVAQQIGALPADGEACEHLLALTAKQSERSDRRAVLLAARASGDFEGRTPRPEVWRSIAEILSDAGWEVVVLTDLARFELQELGLAGDSRWRCIATSSSIEILDELVNSAVVIGPDHWITDLAQLIGEKVFKWLGAVPTSAAIWNPSSAAAFSDAALDCLGCHPRFGDARRNVCLRGDIACMRSGLSQEVIERLECFLEGKQLTAVELLRGRTPKDSVLPVPSAELSLENWSDKMGGSVLVLIPLNPKYGSEVRQKAQALAERAVAGMRGCRIVFDETGESPARGEPHPYRQNAMAAIRQGIVDRHLGTEKWVFWVDADIVEYKENLIDELIHRAEGGIAAPLVLMEGSIDEPPCNPFGFGPGRFYDVAGFVETGRWARFEQPYFNQPGPVYQLDSVGSCYLVNADLYRAGARHSIDPASARFIEEGCEWVDDSIARNQAATANCYSEHYSVCQFARREGLPVQAFADLVALHARP